MQQRTRAWDQYPFFARNVRLSIGVRCWRHGRGLHRLTACGDEGVGTVFTSRAAAGVAVAGETCSAVGADSGQ